MALGLTQPLTEMSTRNISWPVRGADNLPTFVFRLPRNLGASTYWNPLGLSKPVMGLLYLLPYSQNCCADVFTAGYGIQEQFRGTAI